MTNMEVFFSNTGYTNYLDPVEKENGMWNSNIT